jgi:hypothetical protein
MTVASPAKSRWQASASAGSSSIARSISAAAVATIRFSPPIRV